MNTNQHGWRDSNVRLLLAHVLIKAIEDHAEPAHREDTQAFFDSFLLDWIADGLDLTPWRVRRRIAEGLDPDEVKQWMKYVRRARKGKNGGVLESRAGFLADAAT